MYPYNYSERKMTNYVTRNDKVSLTLNGVILDASFKSLIECIYSNIESQWKGTKHFCNGETSYLDYINNLENQYKVKLLGVLAIMGPNGECIKQTTI